MMVANIPKAVNMTIRTGIVKLRILNSQSGTIGVAVRLSMKRKAPSITAASTSRLSTSGEAQPCPRASDRATISGAIKPIRAAAPRKSKSRQDALLRE